MRVVKPPTLTLLPQFCGTPDGDTAFIWIAVPYCGCGTCWPAALMLATRTAIVSRRWFTAIGAGLRPLLTWQAMHADCP
ncbi:hypothetical protein D3C72_1755930 [compost metagenome]